MSTKPLLQRWNTTAALFLGLASVTFALDTDSDGLDDTVETNTGVYVSPTDTGTDPNTADTDGDGVPDGLEVQGGTDPTKVDAAGWRRVATEVHRPDLLRTSEGVFHTNNWYSLNGVDWQSISYPPHSFWINASGYGGGTFVLTGAVGQLWTSTDFRTWTTRNPGGEDITNVVYGNGVFVVRKFWSTGGLWVSSNQGQTWSSANTGSVPDRGAYSCIAFGNGVFVRPAETGVMISSNGSTWSTITPPNVPTGFGFRGQVLHSAHSGFVLVQKVGSLPGEVEIMTASSSDGRAWSFRSTRVTTSNTGTIELGGSAGELLFVHAYESGRDLTEVWCSADHGHSWRPVEAGPWTSSINDLAYFCGNSTVLAVGTGSEIHTTDLNSFSRRLFTDEFTLRLGDDIRDGGVLGDGDYDIGTSATLTAVPNPGYRFTGWTGDASGTENPLTITMDSAKTVGATFSPDLSDTDGDGLTAYDEAVIYGTDPTKADTDGDGLSDGFEVTRYSVVLETLTWAQAKAHAEAAGGRLATFPNEITWNRARLAIGPDALLDINGLWIGATDSAEEGVWRWITGEPFDFTQWATGEPNDSNNSDYAAVAGDLGGEEGRWYDYRVTTTRDGYLLALGYGTDPLVADTDGDGLPDGDEHTRGTNPFSKDTDSDGLQDQVEVRQTGTNPLLADTDGDSLPDGAEDSDGDGLTNADEVTRGTNPGAVDTDGDGLSDSVEVLKTLTDPLDPDSDDDGFSDFDSDPDGDGLSHGEEIARGTDPNQADTDSDGLPDGVEARQTSTNPLLADSNSNGTPDGMEDSDGDLLTNLEELELGTHPGLADTDGDGFSDWQELGRDRFELVMGSFTHAQAAADAAARGGYLATITSAEEQQAAMAAIDPALLEDLTGFWIGATDAVTEGEWRWGTGESFAYAIWGTGRPSALEGNTLDFAEISGGGGAETGKWYDRTATTVRTAYLLEKSFVINPLAADTDGDGLDDAEEITHGTLPHVADTDGDGSWDGAEVEFGGAPRDSGKLPELKANIRLSATPMPGVEIRFPSMPGKSYIVHASTDLVEWQALGSLVGTGGVMSHSEPRGTHPSRFFKVEASDPPGFVYVAAGTLPSSSELSGQSVASFYIAKTETTWGKWQSVRTYAAANGYDIGSAGAGRGTDYPVTNVSWFQVVKWCNARSEQEGLTPVYRVNNLVYKTGDSAPTADAAANGYRLPTEAQWEFAARGGVNTQNYEYSGSNDVNAVAWHYANSGDATQSVATKQANELGLSDMSGNVWEWCFDVDPGYGGSYRVVRGGSYWGEEYVCRVAYRDYLHYHGPPGAVFLIGFRVARSSVP